MISEKNQTSGVVASVTRTGGPDSPNKRGKVAVLVITISTILLAALSLRFASRRGEANTSVVSMVDNSEIDAGEKWKSSSDQISIVVHNDSDEIIRVDGMAMSCGCVSITPTTFSLRPGESVPVTLTDAVPQSHGSETGWLNWKPMRVAIRPILVGSNRTPPIWTVNWKTEFPFRLDNHRPLSWRVEAEAGLVFENDTIDVVLAKGIQAIESVSSHDTNFRVDVHGFPGDVPRYGLRVRPVAAIPLGDFSIPVDIKFVNTGLRHRRTMQETVTIAGIVTSDISCAPICMSFPPAPVGHSIEGGVFLRFPSQYTLSSVSVRTDDTSGVADYSVVGNDVHCRLVQRVTSVGSHVAHLCCQVATKQTILPVSVDIPVYYHGSSLSTVSASGSDPERN